MLKYSILFLFSAQFVFGWGHTTHRYINKNAVIHLPSSMQQFIVQQSFLEQHSVDADNRRTNDTAMWSEQYRHYLDVDGYPNFKNLSRSIDTLILLHGWNKVKGFGTNPWTLVIWMDSLTAQLQRGDWNNAYQYAADIGHYSGDPHQPLHAAENYNGQLTGNNGIHSRYESTMMGKYIGQISIQKDSVRYIKDIYGFAFNYILHSQSLVDSLLKADNAAKAVSGGSYNDAYYAKLWELTNDMTKAQLQLASINLASLWYTAWVNAGLLQNPTGIKKIDSSKPKSFNLQQNYPNPFNPKTTIQFDVAESAKIKLDIVSLEGKEVASLINSHLDEGSYSTEWNATDFASGIYFVQLKTDHSIQTRKLVFLK